MPTKRTRRRKTAEPKVTERTDIKPSQLIITVIGNTDPIPAGHTPENVVRIESSSEQVYLFRSGKDVGLLQLKTKWIL